MRVTAMLLAAALCAGAQAQPLLTAYRTQTAPQIDGRLDDDCWERAMGSSPFILAGAPGLPEEQTRVYLCRDETNLYVAIEADEGYLEPRLNMLDLVEAQYTRRDDPVYQDDAVELFLQPPGATYHHVAVNSLGAVYDARDQGTAWDGEIAAEATRGTQSWVAEVAISFESMNAAPEGRWRANFARHRTAVRELSTWCGLSGGFHQPDAFGELRFAETGPVMRELDVTREGQSVAVRARVSGDADDATALQAAVTAGEGRSERAVSGPGEQTLTIPAPPEARTVGRIHVTCELRDGEQPVARSAAIPLGYALRRAELALTWTDARVAAWLDGAPIDLAERPVALDLERGLNVVAIEARANGDAPRVIPSVSTAQRSLDVPWLRRTEEPAEGWREEISAGGWEVAQSEQVREWPQGAQSLYLACGLYVAEPEPQLFPKLTTFHVPRGSAQLMRVYVHTPTDAQTDDYRMVVEAPARMQLESVWDMSGGDPEATVAAHPEVDGTRLARYHLSYDAMPADGMDLSIRWGDEADASVGYQTALSSGGTHAWRHMSATVTAPESAVSAHPLIIKWQNRGITGTFWVDNVVFREAGSDENLLQMGTFDEPGWGETYKIKPEGPDGSNCVKLVSTERNADGQQAMWVDKEGVVPVEPGGEYVAEMDVRCEELMSQSSRPLCGLLFRAPDDMPEGELPLFTYFQALGGAVTELPQRSSVTVLPPLKDVRPERARITPCYYSTRLHDDAIGRAYAQSCWQSGITWTYGKYDNNVVEHLAPRGHEVILSMGWHGWNPIGDEMHEYFDDHPELHALGFDGEPHGKHFCPTWLLSDEGAPVVEMLERWLLATVNARPYAGVNWDLEQPVVDPPTFCTCERCIAAFREHAGIADDVAITPESLLDEHRDAWVEFRCAQNAQMAGRLKEMLEKADRPVEFSVYSGFQSTRTREHYGVDWAMLRPHLDLAIAGYGGSAETVAATLEAMGETPFMGGEMWYLSHRDDARPAPKMQTWRNRLLRKFVESGCTGVLIWQLASMDGGALYATSEATEIIARYEDWLRHERRCDERVTVEGLDARDWAAFERDGEVLVLLMSFSAEPRQVTVTVDGQARVRDLAACATDVFIVR